MRPAPVGFQCPECVAAAAASMPRPQARRGGISGAIADAPVTVTLIGLNLVVWLAIQLTGGNASPLTNALALQDTALCVRGNDGYFGVSPAECAAYAGTLFPGVADGAPWQLLSSMFAHVSPLHLGLNMLALWFLGSPLERVLGRARFLALYLLSGLTGSVAVFWLADPFAQTLGASGAIFGLLGALLMVVLRRGGDARNVIMWLGINVAFTFAGGATISWQGHLGGLVGGVLVTLILLRDGRSKASTVTWVMLGGYALVLAGLAVLRAATLT